MLASASIDAKRVLRDLRELARRTSDEAGAQRVAWTPLWSEARAFLAELVGELGFEPKLDEAGNAWVTLAGADPAAPSLALGSHLDSVPDGGWLDGALGVMAAVGVLRAHAATGSPSRSLVLVDWADEEGARFGRSLFGSSAFAGTLDPAALRDLTDEDGRTLAEVLAEHGVSLDRAGECATRREGLGAYLELHIEQGPVLERESAAVAAVNGCQGIERVRFTFRGQAAHAGTTPMELRHDAGLAAASAALEIEGLPRAHGGVATTGELRLSPGVATAVAGEARLACDLRHPERGALSEMLAGARAVAARAGRERGCELAEEPIWRIDPVTFDPKLVDAAVQSCREAGGRSGALTSGALHDAAEVAGVMPAAMVFCSSRGGISHAAAEDTAEDDLVRAIEVFGELASRVLGS